MLYLRREGLDSMCVCIVIVSFTLLHIAYIIIFNLVSMWEFGAYKTPPAAI